MSLFQVMSSDTVVQMTQKHPEQIPDNIINLAKSIEINKNVVIISDLNTRSNQLNNKSKDVHQVLTWECNKRNIGVIKYVIKIWMHKNTVTWMVYTWIWGTKIITENILFYLSKFCSIDLHLRLVSNLKKCSVGSDS